ncbi:TPA: DUF969 family protein [Klebsiella pneumoniae]|uniref:5-oxoproline transporter, DUF969 family subunit n=1 Tax=Klebsiella pneumoniae TaxID=573 RepID=UPI00224BA414|nr:DUF969 family protein [Klebsiella pneumoniae]MBQ5143718.1 DUF969 family protein [Klebsiella pneumoniae]
MQEAISLWPLIGIAVIVVGFVLRFNPVLVVIISGIVTGVAAHMPIATILEKLGEGFLNTRNLPFILLLPLAVIGLLERHGLKERAQAWIAKIHSATAGRLLIVYLFVREATAALGLTSLGGHPQMVRPLLAPMAANFNIVPAALLELPDKNAVIKAQIPTGILLLIVNVFLLYFLMFL